MQQFVLGVVFDPDFKHVGLLQKTSGPKFLIGKWNFPGGKVEAGESLRNAVAREVKEETGLVLAPQQYRRLISFSGSPNDPIEKQFKVTAFTAVTSELFSMRTMTFEPVAIFRLDRLPVPLSPQLPWVLEMAKDPDVRNQQYRIQK